MEFSKQTIIDETKKRGSDHENAADELPNQVDLAIDPRDTSPAVLPSRLGQPQAESAQRFRQIETVLMAARARVVAEGEMDLACVVALNRAMSAACALGIRVDLDLSAVTFVHSRFAAAVGGWDRQHGLDVTIALPDNQGLRHLLALGSRKRERPRSPAVQSENTPPELAREAT
jgi:hypothetical protein